MSRVALSFALLLALGATAQDIGRLRQKLADEDDPGKRAKISVKIGAVLLKETRRLYRQDDYSGGEAKLQEYLGEIRTAYCELRESGRRARRHPRGFKEMEIHMRKSRRALTAVSRRAPMAVRQPLDRAVEALREMRSNLLRALMNIDQPPKEEK